MSSKGHWISNIKDQVLFLKTQVFLELQIVVWSHRW